MALDLDRARAEFGGTAGYLASASMGLPCRGTVTALREELSATFDGRRTPADYEEVVATGRSLYAALVGVDAQDVAIGSQTSVLAGVVAAWLPAGSEVLTVEGEFTSMTYPFLVRPDLTVRAVPLADLATAVHSGTTLVAFSYIQSATGDAADVDAVVREAARHGARTFCDLTQAAGIHPVDATQLDLTVCHAYKWLCAPRGAAFLTVREELQQLIRPVQAGWYAGRDVWSSVYGTTMDLAPGARRFDVSPVWSAWVGAVPALELFTSLDIGAVWRHATGLGAMTLEALGEPAQQQAIVTVADERGEKLRALATAGIRASGRAGRLRLAYHLWNDEDDVERVARALHRSRTAV
ncbi:aminotransferase class V-fold PLP-dependent enzyme [Georgenia satyanarayanai]|uniref:aminotransferase class V-fold PLP-dependent enzyme n=1 Tax=Georgenia satyanarayanai TaxID=860221 RepID=UPI0012657DFE|nr:aminotransferase class V-fold PLP-dependent enzyme [Georgenia satyanarayanai]